MALGLPIGPSRVPYETPLYARVEGKHEHFRGAGGQGTGFEGQHTPDAWALHLERPRVSKIGKSVGSGHMVPFPARRRLLPVSEGLGSFSILASQKSLCAGLQVP
jgi:hypothetical protein